MSKLSPEEQQRIDDLFKTTAMAMGEVRIDIETKGAGLIAEANALVLGKDQS